MEVVGTDGTGKDGRENKGRVGKRGQKIGRVKERRDRDRITEARMLYICKILYIERRGTVKPTCGFHHSFSALVWCVQVYVGVYRYEYLITSLSCSSQLL